MTRTLQFDSAIPTEQHQIFSHYIEKYFPKKEEGYYLLRTKPRTWIQLTDTEVRIGGIAAPTTQVDCIQVVDIDEALSEGRDRFYTQPLFISHGKVFNASAYVLFQDNKGITHCLLIHDQRQWNAPIGRVDSDEFKKSDHQKLLPHLTNRKLEEQYCILAAIRELKEETNLDLLTILPDHPYHITTYSSDDENPLAPENNKDTTVTMQVIIELGTLSADKIKMLKSSLKPQESEHITDAQFLPVSSSLLIKQEDPETKKMFYTLQCSKTNALPVFSIVGKTLTTLVTKIETTQKEQTKSPAPWFVLDRSFNTIPTDATLYAPENCCYLEERATASDRQKDILLIKQMTGIEIFDFSPERLALHETIIYLSLSYQWQNQKYFSSAVRTLYNEKVKPAIVLHAAEFKKIERDIVSSFEDKFKTMAEKTMDHASDPIEKSLLRATESFEKALKKAMVVFTDVGKKLQIFNDQEPGASRPTLFERQNYKEAKALIQQAEKNRYYIISQAVIAQRKQEAFVDFIKKLVSDHILTSENTSFIKRTCYARDERRAILVVGGPAAGKGTISGKQFLNFGSDMVELNPDLYKEFLLPFDTDPEKNLMHGTLTHYESSLIFDRLLYRWKEMCAEGQAPHVLVDIARAGWWIRNELRVGATIEAHTPILPVLEALKRSFSRGVATGRYMPTAGLIQSHREQTAINLTAMQGSCHFTFYDTSGNADEEPPVIAVYDPKTNVFTIYDIAKMMHYFENADLNPTAVNAFYLFGHNAKSTLRQILNYAEAMTISIITQKTETATLYKNEEGYVFDIVNWDLLKSALDETLPFFAQGLIENNISIKHCNAELQMVLDEAEASDLSSVSLMRTTASHHVMAYDLKKVLETACILVEKGIDYERNVHSMWVYTPPSDPATFFRVFPFGITLTKDTKSAEYKAGDQITFDIREFHDIKKVEESIAQLKLTGKIEQNGIAMTSHVRENYFLLQSTDVEGIEEYQALPKPLRAMIIDDVDAVQVLSSSGKLQKQLKDGWVKCAYEHVLALQPLVENYRKAPENEFNQMQLLQAIRGKIYTSGPGNIEDGYHYYVSRDLAPTLFAFFHEKNRRQYQHKLTNEKYIAIKIDSPLNISKQLHVNAGEYLFLPAEKKAMLSDLIAAHEKESQNACDDFVAALIVVDEDSVRRTYGCQYNEARLFQPQTQASTTSPSLGVTIQPH